MRVCTALVTRELASKGPREKDSPFSCTALFARAVGAVKNYPGYHAPGARYRKMSFALMMMRSELLHDISGQLGTVNN